MFIQFAILGLASAAGYTLLGQGLVLIYRGSGVVNFAQGAVAMISAFVYYELHERQHWSFAPAFIVTLVFALLLGGLVQTIVMRPLAKAATLTKAISTLGLLTLLQGVAQLIWGETPVGVSVPLPKESFTVGNVTVLWSTLTLFFIALVITSALAWGSSHTTVGLALRANAEHSQSAAALGWSPARLGLLTWAAGSVLAAVAGVLIAPSIQVSVNDMPLLVIPVLAAVLVGRFESFWLTILSAVVIGVAQSEISAFWHLAGAAQGVPFIVLIAYLLIRGEARTTRQQVAERLPEVGSGRPRWIVGTVLVVATAAVVAAVNQPDLTAAVTNSLAWGIIILSVVVLIGYAGQLSLAQFAIGGIATLVAGHLAGDAGFPFIAALIVAMIACIAVGIVVALPALRTRGINLAIVTLGLSVAATAMVFNNGSLTGGFVGIDLPPLKLFGLAIDPLDHPGRYAIVVYVCFLLAMLLVAAVRRGTTGARLVATRTNERAAAALGVSVYQSKIFAFGVAAGLAALGGVLLAFTNSTLLFENNYDPLQSVLAVGYGIVGGAGYVTGAPVGSTLPQGGFGNWVLDQIFPNASPVWLSIVSGALLLLMVVMQPDGVIRANIDMVAKLRRRTPKASGHGAKALSAVPLSGEGVNVPQDAVLEVSGTTVQFGSVAAVDDVSFTVRPGEVVGLIGPNGAGKSTVIDAITGFVRPRAGTVRLGGNDLTSVAPFRRARAGIGRSFQSLELFDSATVLENLQVGCDDGRIRRFFTDLIWPTPPPLTARARLAISEFGLEDDLDTRVSDLPYGRRRLVAIARAAATADILLLDEPAAGLGDQETTELREVIGRFTRTWGLGVLVVEHDMSFIMSLCDRIVVLNFGAKIAEGTPAEVSRDPRVVAAYLGGEVDTDDRSGPGESGTVTVAEPAIAPAPVQTTAGDRS